MKEVLSLFTFVVGTLCFVMFFAVLKPNAVSAVPGTSKPACCNTQASPVHTLPPAPVCRRVVA
jgi:hypothetical protein